MFLFPYDVQKFGSFFLLFLVFFLYIFFIWSKYTVNSNRLKYCYNLK